MDRLKTAIPIAAMAKVKILSIIQALSLSAYACLATAPAFAQIQLLDQMHPAASARMGEPATLPKTDIGHDKWLIPDIILDGARSFITWLELPEHPASINDSQNKGRLSNFDGLFAPQMQQHWQSFAEHPSKHYLKNIGTEWVRLDPQRAYKTLSFLFLAANGLLLMSSLIAGIGIGLGLRRRAVKSLRDRGRLSA
jgi:hypothetical protein